MLSLERLFLFNQLEKTSPVHLHLKRAAPELKPLLLLRIPLKLTLETLSRKIFLNAYPTTDPSTSTDTPLTQTCVTLVGETSVWAATAACRWKQSSLLKAKNMFLMTAKKLCSQRQAQTPSDQVIKLWWIWNHLLGSLLTNTNQMLSIWLWFWRLWGWFQLCWEKDVIIFQPLRHSWSRGSALGWLSL